MRAKYRVERDRRVRPDGLGQYRSAAGQFGYYANDPYTERIDREPLTDRVEALVIGAGFGGLLSASRLRQDGVESIRLMDEAGDVGGTCWTGTRESIATSYVYMPLLEEVGYVPKWRYAPGEEVRQHATNSPSTTPGSLPTTCRPQFGQPRRMWTSLVVPARYWTFEPSQ